MATTFTNPTDKDAFGVPGQKHPYYKDQTDPAGREGLYGKPSLNNYPSATGATGVIGYLGRSLSGEHGFSASSPVLNTQDYEAQRAGTRGVAQGQRDFGNYLQMAATGQAPTAAQGQLMAGKDAAINAAAAQAAGARGGNVALANRAAARTQGTAIQNASRDAAILRAQEQQQYAQLANQNINEQRLAELQNQGMSRDMAIAQLNAESSALSNQTTIAEGTAERRGGFFGDLLSDIRAKEEVQPGGFGSALSRALSASAAPAPAPVAPASTAQAYQQPAQITPPDKGESSSGVAALIGGMISDQRAKTLTRENAGLKGLLIQALTGSSDQKPATDKDVDAAAMKALGKVETDAMAANAPVPGRMEMPDVYSQRPEAAKRAPTAYPVDDGLIVDPWKDRPATPPAQYASVDDTMISDPWQGRAAQAPAPQQDPLFPTPTAPDTAALDRAYALSDKRSKEYVKKLEQLAHYSGYTPDDLTQLKNLKGTGGFHAALDKASNQNRANLEPVEPYTYRYKPEAAAMMGTDTEPREGFMAQDLAKSPAFQAAVVPGPGGLLAVDKDRLMQATTAELGGLDKRVKALEFGPSLKRASGMR